jgi:hypothetical protein
MVRKRAKMVSMTMSRGREEEGERWEAGMS